MNFFWLLFRIFNFLYFIAYSIDISYIPSTGNPPSQRYGVSSVYDELENRIIIYGGYSSKSDTYLSDLYIFDLNSFTWLEILPDSSTIPEGLEASYMYLRSDRTLLIFFGLRYSGVSADVYSFNLITHYWKLESLTGDLIKGRKDFGATEYINYQNESFIAIFGGMTYSGSSNELFL